MAEVHHTQQLTARNNSVSAIWRDGERCHHKSDTGYQFERWVPRASSLPGAVMSEDARGRASRSARDVGETAKVALSRVGEE